MLFKRRLIASLPLLTWTSSYENFLWISGFTAEQWKNWMILYSLSALKDVLPWQHYNCWHLFVKVCFLLCRRTITHAQLLAAEFSCRFLKLNFLVDFWKAYKHLYGTEACTPNTYTDISQHVYRTLVLSIQFGVLHTKE